jgi:hypothetical protein
MPHFWAATRCLSVIFAAASARAAEPRLNRQRLIFGGGSGFGIEAVLVLRPFVHVAGKIASGEILASVGIDRLEASVDVCGQFRSRLDGLYFGVKFGLVGVVVPIDRIPFAFIFCGPCLAVGVELVGQRVNFRLQLLAAVLQILQFWHLCVLVGWSPVRRNKNG